MNKSNRGAMTNLRHILYDVIGNLTVYVICHAIFIFGVGRTDISMINTFLAATLYTVIYILVCKSQQLYDVTRFYYPDRVVRNVLCGCVIATAITTAMFYFAGRAMQNRSFYLLYFLLSAVEMLISAYWSFTYTRRKAGSTKTLMIGDKKCFEQFNQYIRKTNVPFNAVGYVHLSGEKREGYLGSAEQDDLEQILREQVIDQVYIMKEHGKYEQIRKCLDMCLELGIVTRVVLPQITEASSGYISSMGTYPIMTYHISNLNTCEQALKRVMDIIGSLVGILLSSPLLIIAAAAIKLDSDGPVFFRQTRVGHNGRRFQILKLRTMTTDAEVLKANLLALNEVKGGFMFKIKEDPRVTKVGAFLRKTSIDEIPQFFNVLKGEMSLVGTRPPTEDEVDKYALTHWRRLRTKPGITGLWQISGRSNICSFDEIVGLDTEYIQQWSIFKDIKIILKTIAVVLKRKGAY